MVSPVQSSARHPLAMLVLSSSLLACGARSFARDDDRAIRAVLRAQQDAWNRGDLEGYMRGYVRSDALVFTSGGNVRRGWAATFAKYKARYGSDTTTMGTLGFEILEVQPLGADGAIVLGTWDLTNTPSAGHGLFSVALQRTDTGWVVVHDHTTGQPQCPSLDPARPAARSPASPEP
jgi:uncharacterized protein (TIGR02246 family)